MFIDNYWLLFVVILLYYVSVVCINGGSGPLFSAKYLKS